MNHRFQTAGVAVLIAIAVAACGRQNANSHHGDADRNSSFTNPNTPNADPTGRAPSPVPEPDGSTVGAASGSLQEHPRAGASSGTADRNGSTATRPGENRPPNVDPSRTGSRRGRPAEDGTSPGVPGQQRKQ